MHHHCSIVLMLGNCNGSILHILTFRAAIWSLTASTNSSWQMNTTESISHCKQQRSHHLIVIIWGESSFTWIINLLYPRTSVLLQSLLAIMSLMDLICSGDQCENLHRCVAMEVVNPLYTQCLNLSSRVDQYSR